jgi:hypothetical protein
MLRSGCHTVHRLSASMRLAAPAPARGVKLQMLRGEHIPVVASGEGPRPWSRSGNPLCVPIIDWSEPDRGAMTPPTSGWA